MSSNGGIKKVLIGCAFMFAGGMLVICLLTAWVVWSSGILSGGEGGVTAAIRVGEEAPDFELDESTGEAHRLSSYQGKVVLLNFWTTWCGPCESEMPALENLSTRYSPDDLVILAVNCNESSAKVTAYAKEHNLTFPLLIDRMGTVARTYHVRAYPTTIIVGREGIIQQVNVGSMEEEQFVEMISDAIAAPPKKQITPTASLAKETAVHPGAATMLEGCVNIPTLNVREGPSLGHKVYRGLSRDECKNFDARSADSTWLRLADLKTNTGGRLWVSAQFIDLKGSIADLPGAE